MPRTLQRGVHDRRRDFPFRVRGTRSLLVWADKQQTFHKPVREGLPTTRKLARSVNTSAFVGTNPTDKLITSRLPVTLPEF
jgi:hypothetical protein